MAAEALLNTRMVASWLRLHPETVLKWAREGKLPSLKLPSGAIRYDPDQLETWLAERESWPGDSERATSERGVSTATQDAAHRAR